MMATKNRTCTFPECGRPLNAKALCSGHYQMVRRGEDLRPLTFIARRDDSLAVRMERNTEKSGTCWNWCGTVQSQGYGTIVFQGKKLYAHRVAYEQAFDAIPSGLFVDHMCRNRLCVNPGHLQVVTRQENNENLSLRADNISGERGVTWDPVAGKWRGTVGHNYRYISVGKFDSISGAADAVRHVRMQLHTNNLEDRGVVLT